MLSSQVGFLGWPGAGTMRLLLLRQFQLRFRPGGIPRRGSTCHHWPNGGGVPLVGEPLLRLTLPQIYLSTPGPVIPWILDLDAYI